MHALWRLWGPFKMEIYLLGGLPIIFNVKTFISYVNILDLVYSQHLLGISTYHFASVILWYQYSLMYIIPLHKYTQWVIPEILQSDQSNCRFCHRSMIRVFTMHCKWCGRYVSKLPSLLWPCHTVTNCISICRSMWIFTNTVVYADAETSYGYVWHKYYC